ncbi:uncharacterized protein LOC116927426 isoform X2 [Daphnia magna]|uniref:Transmembrane protein n=1 Tax=Daphnia magna TaxID=35525 RepID=A0ABR0AMI3_9CRUS|nr:uncharacterized protein LOC116927426 isoform X2 [Daphnia magna]KAK4026331.1 hypothetical protein OUZ56_015337 [Daphnia magna]
MASQAAAILRVIERKRQEKQRATLAKIQHIPQNTTLHVYSDRLTHQPRRSCQGWDVTSDVSGTEGRASNVDHRQMADKAYQKWRNKQKIATSLNATVFRKSYIAAGQSNNFDTLLWFGLTVLLTGTIVSFVGLGEKGFRTSYLRLMGPILCGTGLAVVIIRIGICCVNGRKKATTQFYIRDQLAKVVTVQQAVAVRSIQYKSAEGPPGIPSIRIDPSCDSGMMKSSVTAGTDLSPEGSPVLSGENVPLIDIESAEHTSTRNMTIAVIESECISKPADASRPVDFTGNWRKLRDASNSELALNPSSLATHENKS